VCRANDGTSASFSSVLVEESCDDIDDLELLSSRELPDLLKNLLDLADRPRSMPDRCISVAEDLLDGDAEHASELR